MLNISIAQALSVWDDLCTAFYGKNSYGGDTAEIYAYRLQERRPSVENVVIPAFSEKVSWELAIQAGNALYMLLDHFREKYDANILVDGVPLEKARDLLTREGFNHRVHVKVSRPRRRR